MQRRTENYRSGRSARLSVPTDGKLRRKGLLGSFHQTRRVTHVSYLRQAEGDGPGVNAGMRLQGEHVLVG